MRHAKTAAAGAAIVLGVLAAWAGQPATADSSVDPRDFTHPKANPYFPLVAGTVSQLRGSSEGEQLRELVTITYKTKVIQGITTTVVHDVVRRADGSLAEKTQDWYAADNHGNVWYFGERTATYDQQGHVQSREGSWQAGVDGAIAGLIMPAHPGPTDAYRQELYRGHAEDQAWIVDRHTAVHVPYGSVRDALRTFEWTRFEPGVMSAKFYARGLGIVRERDVAGGDELFELVSVTRHPRTGVDAAAP